MKDSKPKNLSKKEDKKFRLKAKNLFLTYPQCDMEKQAFLFCLQEKEEISIRYALIVQETHEDGKKHIHAYLQLNDQCHIRGSKTLDVAGFHGNYKSAKGYWEDNWNYLTKEDKEPLEFGEPSKAKNKSEETKEGIARRNKLLVESDLTTLVQTGEINIERYLTIKKAVTAYKMDSVQIGGYNANRLCIWVCDNPGAGKSRFLRDHNIPFYSKPQNKWWDGYKQEPVVLVEDFDKMGSGLSHYLKIWSDKYSFYGEIKGGTVPCNYTVLIVTSNYFPSQLWKEEDDPELLKAIDRRFIFRSVAELLAEELQTKIIELIK